MLNVGLKVVLGQDGVDGCYCYVMRQQRQLALVLAERITAGALFALGLLLDLLLGFCCCFFFATMC